MKTKKTEEKFYIKTFICETVEDDFEKGEQQKIDSCWTFKDFHLDDEKNSFDTIEDAIKKICSLNCFDYNRKSWIDFFSEYGEDIGRFDGDILVDEMNNEATKEEIGWWKNGKKKLWNCHITACLGVKTVRELTEADLAGFKKNRNKKGK